jgi:hypothetical protein
MIELIFAIVVIGISVLSLPMIIRATQKGIEENIVQEAIFAASSELIGATAGYWDERSMEDVNTSTLSRVIDIHTGTESPCDADRLRPGHIKQPKHRKCLKSTSSADLDLTNTSIYSLDDAEQTTAIAIFESNGGTAVIDATGYKSSYTSSLSVSRIGDIKYLESKIYNTKTPPELIVNLKMQSANVGEIDYYKRSF